MLYDKDAPAEDTPTETLEKLYDRIEELKEQLDQENNPSSK